MLELRMNFLPLQVVTEAWTELPRRCGALLGGEGTSVGPLRHTGILPSWEQDLAQGCQTAGLPLHLLSKWYESCQAEIWTSLFPSHPWLHPRHSTLFPGPCLTQKDLLGPPPSSSQALPCPALPALELPLQWLKRQLSWQRLS